MADAFAKEVRDLWTQADEADRENREEAVEDLKFAAGEQWDERVRDYRESSGAFPLPCLTINTLPQFIGQVIGDRRANQTSVKVLPREDGDVKIAEVRSELIRSIELHSKAGRVYTMAFDQEVTCGIGNFRIDVDYAYEDAFERDLFINPIPNPLAVRWDPLSADPTARDAGWCFVGDEVPIAEYERRFPDAARPSLFDNELIGQGWLKGGTVMVPEFWRIEERERTIALMADGSTRDVTGQPEAAWTPLLYRGPDGQPVIREKAKCKYAVMVLTNGMEALSDPFELKLPRLPIIRCMGREIWTGEKRVRFGLTRFARDPQRLKNYWRSVVAELLMTAPRDNYLASAKAVEGRENDWPNTRIYNDDAPAPPIQVTLANMAAIVNEAQMCAQDMKDTTGLHDASLGARSNETSGVAIQRRQNEGDIATIIYHDNMNSAMQEAGEVLNALIPAVYDTARTIRTIGADDAVKLIRVNDPNFALDPGSPIKEAIPNLAVGRYDVTITTGPAYMTRRQEAAASMIEASRIAPSLLEAAGDLIAKAQDWPNADEIAERLKRAVPPQLLGDDERQSQLGANDPAAEARMAEQQQMAKAAAELEMRQKTAEVEKAEADAERAKAEASKAKSEALKAEAELAALGAHLAETAGGLDDLEEAA